MIFHPSLSRAADARDCPACHHRCDEGWSWKMGVLRDREPVKDGASRRMTRLGHAAPFLRQHLAQGAGPATELAVVRREALRFTHGDVSQALQKYQQVRYLRTGRVQLSARFYGDICHAPGVQRELRNQVFQSGTESAGFAGLPWLHDGIEPLKLFK